MRNTKGSEEHANKMFEITRKTLHQTSTTTFPEEMAENASNQAPTSIDSLTALLHNLLNDGRRQAVGL